MNELFNRIASNRNKKWNGWYGKIIIDEKGKNNTWIGRNFAYKPISVIGNFDLGDEIEVEIIDSSAYELSAKILNSS